MGTAASPIVKERQQLSGSSSSRIRGTRDREDQEGGRRRAGNVRPRDAAATEGRRREIEEGRRTGAGLTRRTETIEEAGRTETGRLTVAGDPAEKEIGASGRLDPRDQT